MEIFHQFTTLPRTTSSTNFTALELPGNRHDFLAKNIDGAPVFLLHDASEPQYSPGINFKYLTAQFHTTCEVHVGETAVNGQFAIVSCDGSMPELHEIFIRCFGAAVEELPIECGTRELKGCIQKLLELFKVMSQPSTMSVTGLWAELYVIYSSGNVVEALTTWHENPSDRFDFSWSTGRLEVKATTQSVRTHQFSLEQLANSVGSVGYVVSFLMQPLSGGVGIFDLATRIEAEVNHLPTLKQKLWANIAKALGNEFSEKIDKRFDMAYAERSAVFFEMTDIPRPDFPSDPRIIAIKFTADLTTVVSSVAGKGTGALRKIFLIKS